MTEIRERADMTYTNFVSDAELLRYINKSYTRLYNLLVAKFEDYNASFSEFALTPGTAIYNLPENFFKCLGVDYQVAGDDYVSLEGFTFRERNRFSDSFIAPSVDGDTNLRYRILGNTLTFIPVPSSSATVRLWYVPAPTKFTSTTQLVDGISGWEELVILDSAIKCLQKEESDTTALVTERALLAKEIEEVAANRNIGEPQRVLDVRGGSNEDLY